MTGAARRVTRARASLRPARLADVIGQAEAVDVLTRAVAGAQARGEMPGHILLCGSAGTGKTTLALCVAREMDGELVELWGTALRTGTELHNPLINLDPRGIVFIDEVHRMWRPAQEVLFPVMEDGRLPLGNGRMYDLPRLGGALGFTIMGATTDPERLLTPMLDRFVTVLRLRLYRVDELVLIANRAAGVLGVDLAADAAEAIARAAAGIPRVVIRLVRTCRDYASGGVLDLAAVEQVLASPSLVWRMEGRDAG